jgi:uncharacterized membrane protein YtjA (UPF0391 family)
MFISRIVPSGLAVICDTSLQEVIYGAAFSPTEKRHTVCLMTPRKGGVAVLYYALVFLIVGLIAGVLGATGVAAVASQIAWILFIVGIILLVIHLATGRRGPVV